MEAHVKVSFSFSLNLHTRILSPQMAAVLVFQPWCNWNSCSLHHFTDMKSVFNATFSVNSWRAINEEIIKKRDMHRKQNMNRGTPKNRHRDASQTECELSFFLPHLFPSVMNLKVYLFVTLDCSQYLIPLWHFNAQKPKWKHLCLLCTSWLTHTSVQWHLFSLWLFRFSERRKIAF